MFQNIAELIDIDSEQDIASHLANKKSDPASRLTNRKQLLQLGFSNSELGQSKRSTLASSGWEILKKIGPSTVKELISVNLLKDLLLSNFRSEVKNRLIRWIVEKGQSPEYTMAVKQHVTELTHNQPKYDINYMIELIEALQANPEAIPTDVVELKTICEQIVLHLAHTPFRWDGKEIKTMKNELGKVRDFFHELKVRVPQHTEDIVTTCLKTLYKHMISDGETSNYASAVLDLLDKEIIKSGVQWILQQNDDAKVIKKVYKTLSQWLTTYDYASDLNIWISEIIIGIKELQKYDLLFELSFSSLDSYLNCLPLPIYQAKIYPVLLCMLMYVDHTPDIFHMIIPKVPKILLDLDKNGKVNGQSIKCNQQYLIETLMILMARFPDPGHRYNEMEECLKKYPRSNEFRQTLNVAPWRDASQNAVIASANARVGLVNLGNTCYMNSVLQALVMTKQFSRAILLSTIEAPLFFQIQELLALLLHSDRPELTPRALLAAARPPDFIPGYQQDSSEFLGYLLEKLHEQEKKLIRDQCLEEQATKKKQWTVLNDKQPQSETQPSECPNSSIEQDCAIKEKQTNMKECTLNENLLPPTLIQKTFDGKLYVTYQCGECGSKSTNLDAIRSFELSFPESNGIESDYSVQKLLDFYCSSEKLIGDNQYYCDKCKRLCDGERSIRIIKSPRNLILTLKHFRYDQHRHTRAKLMNKVLHDETISLRVNPEDGPPFVVRYSLYAAVVHAGTSMDSGHYYTYAQDEPDCWYKFNDNYVTKCSVDELHALSSPNTPYILFYQMSTPSDVRTINTMNMYMDEEMEESASANLTLVSTESVFDCQLPGLEELPLHLRKLVNGHNQSYKEEIQNENRIITQHRISVLPKNRDSDDDPPPNSCGSNSINYSNRFIY